jgi:hypothetical protein
VPLRWGHASAELRSAASAARELRLARIVTLAHDVALDPTSGDVTATTDVTLQAESGPVSALELVVDPGLRVVEATAFERSVLFEEYTDETRRYISITFAPALERGRLITVRVRYAGTLACLPRAGGAQACRLGGEMPFVSEGSAFAGVAGVEPEAERLLVLRRPSGVAAAGTGELLYERDDGRQAVSHWFCSERAARGAHVVVFGELRGIAVSDTSPPVTVWQSTAKTSADAERMAAWTAQILPFMDGQSGRPLPFPALIIAELPRHPALLSASGDGIVLVSAAYGERRESRLEEALAHEISHLFWGTLVAPADASQTALLTEGLATLSELDFAAAQSGRERREACLARRYREHELLLRYHADPANLPSVLVADPKSVPVDEPARTLWTYISTSATLDQLRVTVGEDVFARALQRWAAEGEKAGATTRDFFRLLEEQSGVALDGFYEERIVANHFPRLVIGFEQSNERSIVVRFSGLEQRALPLEVWIEHENGALLRKRVVASDASPLVELPVSGWIRSVRPSPRHDPMIFSRSATPGDIDFDGEVDGADLLHCAWRTGKNAEPHQTNEGFFGLDLDFDPRCDDDSNGRIAEDDLAELLARFGTLREEHAR